MLKKIAFFVGSIASDYSYKTTHAIAEYAGGKFQLDVFSSIGTYGESYFHSENEKQLFDIPRWSDYTGIIIAPDSFSNLSFYNETAEIIAQEAPCPVISLRYRDERFYNVLFDDCSAMECMVKHFVEVHGFKRICHMTGRLELEDARLRLKGYRDTMDRYHLPVTEHMIFEGTYWNDRGDAAVDWFLQNETGQPPEAIVCANDYMALSVVKALKDRGIRVPEDICVSGFDNIDEVLYSSPRITSMDVSAGQMGITAIKILERLCAGETVGQYTYVPIIPCFRESCGCQSGESANQNYDLPEQIEYLNKALTQATYMNWDYESCLTYEELFSSAFRHSMNFDYEKIFICLCDRSEDTNDDANDLESQGQYTENMILYSIFSRRDGSYAFYDLKFPRQEILPARYRENTDAIYIFPLYSKNHCFGYIALQTPDAVHLHRFFILWMQGMSSGMDKIDMAYKNKAYLQFKQQSRLDDLTGLYNRREMENILRRKKYDITSNRQLYIMTLDMDGLKFINDTYGHIEGDNALCALSGILTALSGDNVSAARIGGDEFVLCVTAKSEDMLRRLQADINKMLDSYNQKSGKPYSLSVSIGYAKYRKEDGIIGCMKEADAKMYHDKSFKKNTRTGAQL